MPQILDHLGRPISAKPRGRSKVRGSYDAAQTTDDNRKHWSWADSLSANAANDPATRQTLRDRSRYECANNGYLYGLIDTIAIDLVGTGPRPQLKIPGVARTVTREIERLYGQWAKQINLAEDLLVGEKTKLRDGEVFGLQINNPKLDPFLPQLDFRLYEAEQCATPDLFRNRFDQRAVDGIRFDAWGNPEEYHLLKSHPGGEWGWYGLFDYDKIPAERVTHWYKPDRPGQARGVPAIASSLPLFAYLRRFTLACVNNAEFAASINGVLESDQAPVDDGSGDGEGTEAFARVEYERGALFTAPAGWSAKKFEAAQPIAEYGEFKGELLNETGRPVNAPGTITTGDYSKVNYSSGRLANLVYHRTLRVERNCLCARVLDPLFRAWLREAFLMGLLPAGLPPIALWSWEWFWDGFASEDPQKDAAAQQTRLETGMTTYAREFAADGLDWEEQFEQRALEMRRLAELGLSMPAAATRPTPQPAPEEEAANVPA